MSKPLWETLLAAHHRVQSLAAAASGPGAGLPRHEPMAAILACSDARVPPSVLFDQAAGDLFVVRIAGNTASPAALASLDYAVAALGVELLVVLGHTGCGAVGAAASGTCGGHLAPIVESICELARQHPRADHDHLAMLNVATTLEALASHDGPVGVAVATGHLELQGAVHDLLTGGLLPVTTTNQLTTPVEAS